MPIFEYELQGTFHIIARDKREADIKANSFYIGSLKLFLTTSTYKIKENANNDNTNRERIQRSSSRTGGA